MGVYGKWDKPCFNDITLEILCIDLRDCRANSVGAVSKNGFCRNRPDGGARRGASEKIKAKQSLASIGATVLEIGVGPKV